MCRRALRRNTMRTESTPFVRHPLNKPIKSRFAALPLNMAHCCPNGIIVLVAVAAPKPCALAKLQVSSHVEREDTRRL